jgi:hypothetical protein
MFWEAAARMIAEPMWAGRQILKGVFSNTMQELAQSRREDENGFYSTPNISKPGAKP